MKKGYWGVTLMKKKLVSIVLTALMLSLTACGTSSKDSKETAESVSQESIETEVSVQNENEVQDVMEPTETSQDEDKKVSEESKKDSKSETVSKDEVKTTSKEEATDKNKDSDKPEASAEPSPEPTKEPVESTPAPVKSQTFNVNITATDFVVTDNGPVNEVVDFGNFIITINGDAHVVSELSGWALKDYSDSSYDVNILVPLAAQDANNTYNFEIKCPDKVKAATITNVNAGHEDQYPFNFTLNNGTMSGTATAVTEQVVVEGSSIWVFFNVKF